MLALAPSKLNPKDLSLFYAIYATYAAISIFDFGLTNKIFVTGYINLSRKEKKNLRGQIIARLSFISLAFSVYGYLILSKDVAASLWAHMTLFLISALFQYVSLLILSYTEGNIDNKIAYILRTLGEIAGCMILGFSLISGLGYLSIYSLMIVRSLPALISFIYSKANKERKSEGLNCESNFTSKLGVVMALGYVASTGLINIIHWMYDKSTSSAFSQMYLVQSTLFSICMSTFLYQQKSIKDGLINSNASEIISLKKSSVKSVQMAYSLMSASALLGAELFRHINYGIIKFNAFDFILLFTFNLFLINNHVSSIIFRMRGAEVTFSLSMVAGLSILGSALLSGYYQRIDLFLYSLVGISLVVNKVMTDRVFAENVIAR